MVFFIEINKDKEKAINLSKDLAIFLKENGQKITLYVEECDVIISLGGDGTFIRAVNKYRQYEKSIIGINCGTLGYLTELNPFNYQEKLIRLFTGQYTVHNRLGLQGKVKDIERCACNDIVIRNNSMNIIDFDVYIDNTFLASFKADGIIVSTPIGSTGYALSCGGSFVDPDSNTLLLNLIAPHTLMNRSIVLNSDSKIKIAMKEVRGTTQIAIDGDNIAKLVNGDIITIEKSENPTKVIEIDKTSFINAISEKLMR